MMYLFLSPNRAIITEMEWMSQALLKVGTEDSGNLAQVTIFRIDGRTFS